MRSPVLSFLAIGLVLTGCVGKDTAEFPTSTVEQGTLADDAADIETPDVGTDALGVPVPVWNVGDAWIGTSHNGDETRPITLVVTKVESDAYTIETDDAQTAGYDAMFDVSYVGRISTSELSGAQQGQPVLFYDFPLTDGKSWTAAWDGLAVKLTATKSARGFDIVGTVDGEEYVRLDYATDLRWFSKLEFVRDDYGITLERVQPSWTGSVVSATAEKIYEGGPTAPIVSPGAGTFTMAEGQTYGVVSVIGGGAQWARAFYLVQPDGMPFMGTDIGNFELEAAGPRGVFLTMEIPAMAGAWQIASPGIHDPTGGFYVSVHQIAVAPKQFPA